MNLLLKSATIIDVTNGGLHRKKRDILIKNGKIAKIAAKIRPEPKTKQIALTNLHVSPGWFDSGVSFGEPGFEERETIENGLKTAARSGFTDIVLQPNTRPLPDSSADIIFLKNAAKGQLTGLHPLGTVSLGGEGQNLAELYDMQNAGAVGFYDFKHPLENANLLKIALQYVQNFDGLVHSFPFDSNIAGKGNVNEGITSTRLGLKGIPAFSEELQVARDLFILEYTGGKLHIPTISTAGSVRLIADAKKKGLNVSCSVAIHNLFFTDAVLEKFDAAYKVLPPLRTQKDIKAMIKGVKDGIVDFVTSDHIPMNIEEKQVEFENAAFGTIGLESAFGALNQLFDTETTVQLLTKGRQRFGLESPSIKEGMPANLSLFDPDAPYRFEENYIQSSSRNSMFLGSKLKGRVYGAISNGLWSIISQNTD